MKHDSIWKINKYDIILAAVLAVAAVLLYVVLFSIKGNEPGKTAVITVNGSLYGTYDLGTDRDILVETEQGMNLIRIEDGKIRVSDADCPDKYCVSDGSISRTGDTLVCLPHRLVVEIRSDKAAPDEDDVDVIAR